MARANPEIQEESNADILGTRCVRVLPTVVHAIPADIALRLDYTRPGRGLQRVAEGECNAIFDLTG